MSVAIFCFLIRVGTFYLKLRESTESLKIVSFLMAKRLAKIWYFGPQKVHEKSPTKFISRYPMRLKWKSWFDDFLWIFIG